MTILSDIPKELFWSEVSEPIVTSVKMRILGNTVKHENGLMIVNHSEMSSVSAYV